MRPGYFRISELVFFMFYDFLQRISDSIFFYLLYVQVVTNFI